MIKTHKPENKFDSNLEKYTNLLMEGLDATKTDRKSGKEVPDYKTQLKTLKIIYLLTGRI